MSNKGNSKNNTEGIKKSIENIIGSETKLKKKRRSPIDKEKDDFLLIIKTLEEIQDKTLFFESEGVDLSNYNEKFHLIIDSLIIMHYGKDISEIIFYYLYERKNPDGTTQELLDEDEEPIPISTPDELWEFIKIMKTKILKPKK